MVKNYHAGNLLSPSLESLYNKKLDKLDKYADDIVCDIYLSLDGKNHVTKIILKSKKFEVVAQNRSDDMYKNVDVCVDSLKTQISKFKPVKKHSKNAGVDKNYEE